MKVLSRALVLRVSQQLMEPEEKVLIFNADLDDSFDAFISVGKKQTKQKYFAMKNIRILFEIQSSFMKFGCGPDKIRPWPLINFLALTPVKTEIIWMFFISVIFLEGQSVEDLIHSECQKTNKKSEHAANQTFICPKLNK